ncbi:MAG: nucleoside hydrolase [Candidatus Bathyarchaeota archaeon]|nr:nucleoside hydrolase [Candidatus Bathyarchaeota archaeon]
MKHIILDTDPGVDDALAFVLTFNSPELKVEAVTTVAGNVNHEKGHRNAKKLLEFLGKTDVPICAGAVNPMLRKMSHAEEFHGKTGLGDTELPEPKMQTDPRSAVQMILEKADELGKNLTLVAVGPLTNIAAAILSDPALPEKVKELVIMGGAFNLTPYGHGNANAVAEFNIWHDPEAARIVFNSGIPMVCAGLDTTTYPEYRMSTEMFNEIKSKNTARSNLVVDLCGSLVKRFNGFSLHDPQAVAYVIDPTIFTTEKYKVDLEVHGEITRGMTVVERRSYRRNPNEENHEIIIKVDAERFLKLIMDRVVGE